MLIRRELPADAAAIAAVHGSAFAETVPPDASEPAEIALVAALRASPAWIPELSLVSHRRNGRVTGHVCLTRGTVDGRPVLALGPLGVLRTYQGDGTGAALMHAVLGAADALGEPLVTLVGHSDYYPRFGFVPGAEVGIAPDVPAWADAFQVRTLTAYTPDLTGTFRYPAPFYDL